MILEIPIADVYSTRHPALDASGIYCFRNTRNGRRYIGSSAKIRRRFNQHFGRLGSPRLLRAIQEHPKHFVFAILERCGLSRLRARENFYLKQFKSFLPEHGYNIQRDSNWIPGQPSAAKFKSVVQLTMTGEFIKQHDSIVGAAQSLKCLAENISNACAGRIRAAYGFRWMHYSDYLKGVPPLRPKRTGTRRRYRNWKKRVASI